ncbi:MAG: hypothetical protein JHC20_06525, partial [Pyrobaculum sp.]|nr:hypothetical protein [Pyrobaculum sp.]
MVCHRERRDLLNTCGGVAAMVKLGPRSLAVLGGVYALVASVIYTLVVTRRLPAEELAVLTVFNSGYAIALSILGYVTSWYPRVLAKEPERFSELAGAGVLASILAWTSLVVYIAIYGKFDAAVLALGLTLLILSAWPAGAYLSIYRQKTLALLGYVSQTAKLAGAFIVRLNPTTSTVLLINIAMSLPTAVAKLARPRIRLSTLKELFRGAPYQTLSLFSALIGGLATYAMFAAGGDLLLSYNYVLFQIGKSVYPALAIVPLMYGSLLAEANKLRRALLDGAVLLYLYLVAAAVMAKSPEWYVALLRPSELGSVPLIEAVWLNGAALLASGILLHADTVLKGVEEKTVFTLRDKPAKALMLDIASAPFTITLIYLLAKAHGALGMVIAFTISGSLSVAYRLWLLGRGYLPLLTKLYLP